MTDWPTFIRESLQGSRQQGRDFEHAWTAATFRHPLPDNYVSTADRPKFLPWVKHHFRAAYYRDGSDAGRAGFDRTDAKDPAPVRVPSCAWGEGCGEARGHGRFGSFCARHAAVLVAVGPVERRDFRETNSRIVRGVVARKEAA